MRNDNGVSLREYFERILVERDKRLDEVHHSNAEWISRAEEALERRMDSFNEFRQQTTDAQSKFATQEGMRSIEARVGLLEGRKQGSANTIAYVVAGATLALSFGAILVQQMLR